MLQENDREEVVDAISSLVQSKRQTKQSAGVRYGIFPIQNNAAWTFYKRQVAMFWTVEEVDLSSDLSDWAQLSDNEQYFIKNVLAFFAGSDGIVSENLALRFIAEIKEPESEFFYTFQMMMENIHSEMYSVLIDTFVTDTEEKTRLFDAAQSIPCVKRKADWGIKWITSNDDSFATRLLAFAIVEGVFFSGSFCAIFWLKERGLMPGLTLSNEFISRDEAMHTDFAVFKYTSLPSSEQLSQESVHAIFSEAVQIEQEFITESIPCRMVGMNSEFMVEYIRMVADRLLVQLGYEKLYGAKNPFPFMDRIGLNGKTNFFERRVSEYSRAGMHVYASTGGGDTAAATTDGSDVKTTMVSDFTF